MIFLIMENEQIEEYQQVIKKKVNRNATIFDMITKHLRIFRQTKQQGLHIMYQWELSIN